MHKMHIALPLPFQGGFCYVDRRGGGSLNSVPVVRLWRTGSNRPQRASI